MDQTAPADEVNPLDEFDEHPAAAGADSNPLDALDSADPTHDTAATLSSALGKTGEPLPEVTVSARGGPEASWSDVGGALSPTLGAKIESKLAGAEEYRGTEQYDSARKKLWQSMILPEAVRSARDKGIPLTEDDQVVDIARHLGIRPDQFTRDWPTYANQSDDERRDFQAAQRQRIQQAQPTMEEGGARRRKAAEIAADVRPNMRGVGLKSIAFDTATMIPDLLAGTAATLATGPVGGAAFMAADIAPDEYSAARNEGLDHRHASTYAALSTLAASVPEIPVFKILDSAPAAKKIIGSIVGEKFGATATGKVIGTSVAQGVTQATVQSLQEGIDSGLLNRTDTLPDALKKIAAAGLTGAVAGAPMGGLHAAMHREPKPTTLQEITAAGERSPDAGRGTPYAPDAPISPHHAEEAPAQAGGALPAQRPISALTEPGQVPEEKTTVPVVKTSDEETVGSLSGADLHAALDAVQKKTVNPAQMESLEHMGLATRSDVNVPRLLPAGRRELTRALRAAPKPAQPTGRDTSSLEGATPESAHIGPESAQNRPEVGEISSTAPIEASKEPEIAANGSEPVETHGEVPQTEPSAIQNRLVKDQDLRAGLTGMKAETGWALEGGRLLRDATTDQVTGRTTWIPNAQWWPNRPKGLQEPQIHAAVDKALAGKPLSKPEQRMVDFMAQVHDERTAMAQTHEELTAAVPELEEQPRSAVDLTLLASRAGAHDANATARVIDTWGDDRPETVARVQGELERIIGRGHQKEEFALERQGPGRVESAAPERTPAARDLFGEERSKEQALADEQRRRDALRSPNKDVPRETGRPDDLFSQTQRQVDFTDQLKAARAETHPGPSDGQKAEGNYRKGRLQFGGMEVAIENPKGSTRSGVNAQGEKWSRKMGHDYGYVVGTEGKDGDAVDVFLTGKPDTGKVFVINQVDPVTGRLDEHKAVLGAADAAEAEKTYRANYPKDWKGLGSLAEMPTAEFQRWAASDAATRIARPNDRAERRVDIAERKRVAEMTGEEAKKALLTHELTAIPNRRAYVESEKLPTQVSIDVDSLKAINDLAGHHAGDELLKTVARVLHEESEHAYHLSGDEFAVQALHPREAQAVMERVTERLKGSEVIASMPDGRLLSVKGLGVSYGVGEDLAKADTALQAHKKEREAQGARAPRGEAPQGLTIGPGEAGREDRGRAGTAEEEVKPKFARRTEPAATATVKAFADRVKSELGLEDFDLRALPTGDIDLELLQVPRDQRGQGIGSRAMERLTRWADENGRRVTLSLAGREKLKDWGTTSSARLERFYRQFGFKSNRGRYKDYALSLYTNMYREPQGPKSRRTESTGGLARTQVERIVHQAVRHTQLQQVPGFPHIEVHQDISTLPAHLSEAVVEQGAQETTGALYEPSTGSVHLIADNNGTAQEVRENLWHEVVGHHGLRMAMQRPEYNAIMDGINRDMPERVQAAAQRNGLDLADTEQRRAAAEEVIAYAAGQHLTGQAIDKSVLPFWKRAVRAVKGFFARMSGRPFYDDRAITQLIQRAQQALKEGTAGMAGGEPAQSTRAPQFYSPVERAVEASKQGRASAEQWLATIKKAAGIKPDELEWLQLEPWLKEHKGPVSKEDLADYIRANRLELQETVHGGLGERGEQSEDERRRIHLAEELRALGHHVGFDDEGHLEYITYNDHGEHIGRQDYFLHDPQDVEAIPQDIRERVRELDQLSERIWNEHRERDLGPGVVEPTRTQYEDYTLPGGQNYREMLLRLPNRPFRSYQLPARKAIFDKYAARLNELEKRRRDRTIPAQEHQRLTLEVDSLREQRDEEANRAAPEQATYKSSHWREPNILAHVRFNERTDADGKKVLFLEELQSDWHQKGRQEGYRTNDTRVPTTAKKVLSHRTVDGEELYHWEIRDQNGQFLSNVTSVSPGGGSEAEALAETRRRMADSRYQVAQDPRVPDAPFKTSWPMLTMKRMVRWAAEHGFDRVAWTTGEQQAERYDLQKHVDRLFYGGRSNSLEGYKDGRLRIQRDLTPEQLPELLGQEAAQKLLAAEPDQHGNRELTGVDLKFGGEGMRGFYDEILPRETDKLIKKYGSKVGRTALADVGERFTEGEDAQGNYVETVHTGMPVVHSFDVTSEMRTAALSQGFPLFARRQQTLALQQPGPKGVYERIRKAVDWLMENPVTRDVRKLTAPTNLSAESKEAARVAREYLGSQAAWGQRSQEALEHFSREIDKWPVADQLEMMDRIEHGLPQAHPELQPAADGMRKMLDTWRDKVRDLGIGALDNFIENYFPHYWADPDRAQRLVASIQGRRPLKGPASFLKLRTIPTIKEGMDAGLKPLTVNPLVMTLLKTREMQRFVTGVTLMKRFKEDGLAQFLKSGRPMPDGWAPINDNSAKVRSWSEEEGGWIERGQYIMPEDAARVINNHVSQSWLKSFAPAQVFRVGANLLNALQLGFSAFHLGFTTLDAIISKTALGMESLLHGEMGKAARNFGEVALGPLSAVNNVRRGHQLLNAYTNPVGATPELAKIVKALEVAGGRAHMDKYYMLSEGASPFRGVGVRSLAKDIHSALTQPTDRIRNVGKAVGNFAPEYATKLLRGMQALGKTHTALEIPFEVAGRLVRASTSWIMEHLVPMQKLGVFADLAKAHIDRHPHENPNEQADSLQRIWASVDNRLGEMVYDNLFWDRTFKDTLHFGIRAVGWNVGTVREIAGAPVDAMKLIDQAIRTGKITADDVGHKIPYVLAMTMTTALYGSILNYLFTGEGPQEAKDYFFPRTGGETNYGTPQRVSLPSYVKDVYEYSQRPGHTVLNKLNPIFNVIGEMWNNEDFFGNPITDPDAGFWKSLEQRGQFVAGEAKPFSLQGAQQLAGSEKPGFVGGLKTVGPYVGLSPAPGYVTSPDQMARRERSEREKKYASHLKYLMNKAVAAKDKNEVERLRKEYIDAQINVKKTQVEVDKDRARSAVSRRKAATSMRQQGLPHTASLVASLPLEPDAAARQYFQKQAVA